MKLPLVLGQKNSRDLLRFRSANAGCLLTLPLSLRNSRHPSRMPLAIWIVGLTALATSLDSAYGGFYGRAIARMLTDTWRTASALAELPHAKMRWRISKRSGSQLRNLSALVLADWRAKELRKIKKIKIDASEMQSKYAALSFSHPAIVQGTMRLKNRHG
jgi:hypothetical protein